MIDFHRINRAAAPRLPAIVHRLLPGGKILCREYVVRNPRRCDQRPGSFKINLRSGVWADFATGDRGGDVISLVAFLEGIPQSEAARLLGHMLSIDVEAPR